MTPELLTQATSLFDSYDKWNAFIELSNARNEIKINFCKEMRLGLQNHFSKDIREKWYFTSIDAFQYKWFLKDYGENSICLYMNLDYIMLWCNPSVLDASKVKEKLNSVEYHPILNCFDFKDNLSSTHLHHFCEERHRFNFKDSTSYPANNEFNPDKLSWFAGNKIDEMVEQIATKINRFRTPEITKLLLELIRECPNDKL